MSTYVHICIAAFFVEKLFTKAVCKYVAQATTSNICTYTCQNYGNAKVKVMLKLLRHKKNVTTKRNTI